MRWTIHKCVCNVMTVANPTQYTNFGKYCKNPQIQIGSKLVRNSDVTIFFYVCYFRCCILRRTTQRRELQLLDLRLCAPRLRGLRRKVGIGDGGKIPTKGPIL